SLPLGPCLALRALALDPRQPALVLEPARRDYPEEEAADVREIRHAAPLHMGHRAHVDDLGKEPEADQQRGWNEGDPPEDEEEQHGLDAVTRIGDDERAHHR